MVHTYLVIIVSPFIKKTNALLAASNAEKIEALCAWIAENHDGTISWDDLTKNSGFSHNELISLFQVYKQQTPMAYIRGVRQQKNASRNSFPQHSLFIDIDKQSSD
jgi:AraC-like DNA-binding protein